MHNNVYRTCFWFKLLITLLYPHMAFCASIPGSLLARCEAADVIVDACITDVFVEMRGVPKQDGNAYIVVYWLKANKVHYPTNAALPNLFVEQIARDPLIAYAATNDIGVCGLFLLQAYKPHLTKYGRYRLVVNRIPIRSTTVHPAVLPLAETGNVVKAISELEDRKSGRKTRNNLGLPTWENIVKKVTRGEGDDLWKTPVDTYY